MANNGQFKKGEVNNPKGRGKGTPNKVTGASREFIQAALDGLYPDSDAMKKDLDKIKDPSLKLRIVTQLFEFITPKLARTDSTVKHEGAVPITIKKTYKKK